MRAPIACTVASTQYEQRCLRISVDGMALQKMAFNNRKEQQ